MVELVHKYGAKRWSLIAQHLKGRIGKQCRERYSNASAYSMIIAIRVYYKNELVKTPSLN